EAISFALRVSRVATARVLHSTKLKGPARNVNRRPSLRVRADTDQLVPRTEEDPPVRDGRSRQNRAAHVVDGKDIELRTLGEHDDEAVVAGDIDLAVAGHRRGVILAQILDSLRSPLKLAGCR